MTITAIENSSSLTADMQPPVQLEPSGVPALLRSLNQWICWRYEHREGKWTKVPIDARTGNHADITDPRTWCSFDEAVAAFRNSRGLAGVGFVFGADDPCCGVDLDECLKDDGAIAPEAQRIVQELGSYAERSPSGKGLKVFLIATKPNGCGCRTKKVSGFKELEIYDHDRFFAVTGVRWENSPATLEHRQDALTALCDRFWKPKPASDQPRSLCLPDDDDLIERAMKARNGDRFKRLWAGDTSLHGSDDSAADMALCSLLAFWTGRDPSRMDRLFRRSGLYREKWERDDYREMTIRKAIEGCSEVYSPARLNGSPPRQPDDDDDHDDRPEIIIDTDEHRVVDETIAVLRTDPEVFQRGGLLVRTVRNEQPRDGIVRSREAVVIRTLPPANLRVRLTKLARFLRLKKEEFKPAHPTAWLVGGIDTRGSWPGVRSLAGISEVPILRADGSICQTPGYDAATGVLYEPKCQFPNVSDDVDIDDAQAALDDLNEVVCDFHFESEDHKATWLAALLTVIGRHAFGGPAPLFLVDANIRGAGKGLLVQCIARIVLGHEMPVSSYAHNTEEMRKQITSIAIAGDSMILLDNLEGQFGNDTLDRALTSTRWKDRVLGKSELVDLPLLVTWFGTGNNVMVGADTLRRILHIRLDVLHERPEDRKDFKHPHLLSWITSERPRLLTAALKILAAYVRAGRPRQNLTAFGSFEGWSDLVREAVVWLGLPDPCNTRIRLAEMADTVSDGLGQLMRAWEAYDPSKQGLHLSEVIASLYPPRDGLMADPAAMAMRSAIEAFVNPPPTRHPTAKQLGNRLRHYRRRVINGMYFDCSSESRRHGMLWRLIKRGN